MNYNSNFPKLFISRGFRGPKGPLNFDYLPFHRPFRHQLRRVRIPSLFLDGFHLRARVVLGKTVLEAKIAATVVAVPDERDFLFTVGAATTFRGHFPTNFLF